MGWHTRVTSRTSAAALATAALACILVVGHEGDASACGACFASQSESTIVSDHRMALSVSKSHTILWDQISYSGNPKEFAYVIPARPGTRLEPSKDAWFTSLDAATRPIIMSTQGGGGGGYYGGGHGGGGSAAGYDSEGRSKGSGGCCSSATTADESAAAGDSNSGAGSPRADSGAAGGSAPGPTQEPVTIVEENTVGPYETVTLHANQPGALQSWLVANGYEIPEIAGPIIEKYVAEDFDFIALRLKPGNDVRSMEPIRIVSPGADPSLPLRLMQIGVGAKVGITLWVISEGRYHTQSFPDAAVDFSKLIWDYGQSRSNYQELSQKAMASGDGRGFITEYADKLSAGVQNLPPGVIGNPNLGEAYASACKVDPKQAPWQEGEAGVSDAGVADAADPGAFDAAAEDGGDDGGVSPPPPPPSWTPKQCDDLGVALTDLHQNDIWVTRLRANLPRAALDATLKLEPTLSQTRFENVHVAASTGTFTPGARIARSAKMGNSGTYALMAGTALIVWRLLKRRKKTVA